MKVTRTTLETGVNTVQFPNSFCGKWLVKNFGKEDILVSFDENFVDNEAVKIPSGYGQVVLENEHLGGLDIYKHDTIYIKGSGEVEVQQLCYRE